MDWNKFINKIIDLGIKAAKQDYIRSDQKDLLRGSIDGFEECRDKSTAELSDILQKARTTYSKVNSDSHKDVWYSRGFYNEIEWVCNVVSAAQYNQNLPTIIIPTVNGMRTAAKILGVATKLTREGK